MVLRPKSGKFIYLSRYDGQAPLACPLKIEEDLVMGDQEKVKKRIGDLNKGEQFFYESAIFEMGWNRIAKAIKSFNPEFTVGKTVKFSDNGMVELLKK